MESWDRNKLRVEVFVGNGEYTLYEDEGDKQAFTTFQVKRVKNRLKVAISTGGDLSVIPEDRAYELVFKNCEPNSKVKASMAYERKYTDELTIVSDFAQEINVDVSLPAQDMLEEKKKELFSIIARLDNTNRSRTRLYNSLVTQTDMEGVMQAIIQSELSERQKAMLLEIC